MGRLTTAIASPGKKLMFLPNFDVAQVPLSATIVRTPAVTAEPPGEGADRSTRVAEELAGAPARLSGAPPA